VDISYGPVSVCVCYYPTHWYYIKMAAQFKLVFDTQAYHKYTVF